MSTTVFIISGANPRQHRVSRDCHWEGTKIAMSAHNASVIKEIFCTLLMLSLISFYFIFFGLIAEVNFLSNLLHSLEIIEAYKDCLFFFSLDRNFIVERLSTDDNEL